MKCQEIADAGYEGFALGAEKSCENPYHSSKGSSPMKKDTSPASFYQQFSPVRSSQSLEWQGIEATRYLLSPGYARVQQSSSSHLLILYLGEPRLLAQTTFAPTTETLTDMLISKGDHALVPANRQVEGMWSLDADVLFLQVDTALLRSIVEASELEASRAELLTHAFVHDQQVEHFGLALLHELQSSGFNTRLYAESLANALAVHLLRHYTPLQKRALRVTSDLSQRRLREVLDYMQEYYTQNLSVADLAAVAQVSLSHFAHLFRATMGMAPHEYLIACRVEHAKQLLLTKEVLLHEVALSCGFADQSHLARHFRRITGVTPGVLQHERCNVL